MRRPSGDDRLLAACAQRGARIVPRSDDVVRDNPRDSTVIDLDDETLLAALADLRWGLADVLESRPSRLVLDVSGVARLSSSTIAVLLWVKRQCHVRGVEVVVRRPSRKSVGVLRRTGLLSSIAIEQPEARASISYEAENSARR